MPSSRHTPPPQVTKTTISKYDVPVPQIPGNTLDSFSAWVTYRIPYRREHGVSTAKLSAEKGSHSGASLGGEYLQVAGGKLCLLFDSNPCQFCPNPPQS